VVEQAIRYQKPLEGLTYLDRIYEQQDDDKVLDSEWLPLLRARLLLAQPNGLEALQTLQPLERFVVRSPELAHLKGTAMLHAYSTKPYRLLAAAEFQKAANLEPRGEHFFALILSFLDSKDFQKAEASFKFWQRIKPRPGEDVWRSLAYGLLNYSQGREAVAAQIWNELSQRNPGFVTVKSMKTNLAEDPNYLKDQLVKKIIPMLPADGPLSPLAVFQ
jgi:tetratricopeptide (TPR) repeat protein